MEEPRGRARGMGNGERGGITRVVCRTLARRGKSATLESRMEMEEVRRWREDWRVVTLVWRGEVIVVLFLRLLVDNGRVSLQLTEIELLRTVVCDLLVLMLINRTDR